MEDPLPFPPLSPTEDETNLLQFEPPSGLVHPDITVKVGLADGVAAKCHSMWNCRIRGQVWTDENGKPLPTHPRIYEMFMTLITLETPKPLPTDPLPRPTAPARPPFPIKYPNESDLEECMTDFEAVLYRFTFPESLLQLFSELGQLIWSNDWLRFFLIRHRYRLSIGPNMVYGVLRWWIYTDFLTIAPLLAQKKHPRLKAEVNYYIPSARGINTFKEWDEVWANAIDQVATVRRKLLTGVSTVFHAKLAGERDKIRNGTPPPTPRKRRAPRSSLDQEICTEFD